jgi:hypothetical protein
VECELKSFPLIGASLGAGVAVTALCTDLSAPTAMATEILGWTFAIACLVLLLGKQLPASRLPDYLSLCKSRFFERDGFCFGMSLDREDDTAMFTVMFQSRYLGRSTARIALRPAGAGLAIISHDIECSPAGFGVAKFPVAIPQQHQGKTVRFEIGADVTYPLGKGGEVRFRQGRTVCHDSGFGGLVPVRPSLRQRFFGHFLVRRPLTIRMTLPSDVAAYVPDSAIGESQNLWSFSPDQMSRYAIGAITVAVMKRYDIRQHDSAQ